MCFHAHKHTHLWDFLAGKGKETGVQFWTSCRNNVLRAAEEAQSSSGEKLEGVSSATRGLPSAALKKLRNEEDLPWVAQEFKGKEWGSPALAQPWVAISS